jgi:hypothetical protein
MAWTAGPDRCSGQAQLSWRPLWSSIRIGGTGIISASAAGGGHLGSATLGEVLVLGAPSVAPVRLSSELAGLAARFPGFSVASRSVVNAQAQVYLAQKSYGNDFFL